MNKEVADLYSKKGIEGVGERGEQEGENTKRHLFSLIQWLVSAQSYYKEE